MFKINKGWKFQHWLVILFIIMLIALAVGRFFTRFMEGFDNPPAELNAKVRYITFHQGNSEFLQISQLAVYTADDPNMNIAPKGTASALNLYTSEPNPILSITAPIDGKLETRAMTNTTVVGGYISANKSPDNFWKLDLGQAYQLSKIVYYNRNDNSMTRAIGTYLTLEDAAGQTVWTSPTITNDDLIVTWTFTQKKVPESIAGPAGPTGLTGLSGPMGPMGPMGPAGPAGMQGKIGPKGDKGMQGQMGPKGDRGPMGFLGFVDLRKKDITGASASSYPQNKSHTRNKKVNPHNSCEYDEED